MPSSGVQTCALRSEEHTSELQSHDNLVCRLLLEKQTATPRPRTPPPPPRPPTRTPTSPRAVRPAARVAACPCGRGRARPCGVLLSFFFMIGAPPELHPVPPPAAFPL